MVKVKICGITNLEDALMCSSYGTDALGFIFAKKSPRFVSTLNAKKILSNLDPYIVRVGVFSDQEREEVLDIATTLKLDVLQFHGKETSGYCDFFKKNFRVIKTIFVDEEDFEEKIHKYNVDAYLFDISFEKKIEGKKRIPKEVLKKISSLIKTGLRVILSGGITAENVVEFLKLNPYAIDVSSGVESFVGKKDPNLVKMLLQKVKNETT